MPLAAPPLEMRFSLLEVHAMWCERKQKDMRPFETLARDLIAALPVELIPFAILSGWIENPNRRDLWCLPEFLACLVYYTERGFGNQVYLKPHYISSGPIPKQKDKGKLASLTELMFKLEQAWQDQILIFVEQPKSNKKHKAEFCISFYASNVAMNESFLIPADRHVIH